MHLHTYGTPALAYLSGNGGGGMDFCAETYFFPVPRPHPVDVRLERELIYDSQFDERPQPQEALIFQRKRASASRGGKRKKEVGEMGKG